MSAALGPPASAEAVYFFMLGHDEEILEGRTRFNPRFTQASHFRVRNRHDCVFRHRRTGDAYTRRVCG